MKCLGHPLFVDELNTIDHSGGDKFLPLLAGQSDVYDRAVRARFQLGMPLLFASNRTLTTLSRRTALTLR